MQHEQQHPTHILAPYTARIFAWIIDRVLITFITLVAVSRYMWNTTGTWIELLQAEVIHFDHAPTFTETFNLMYETIGVGGFVKMMAVIAGVYMIVSGIYVISQLGIWSTTAGKYLFGIKVVDNNTLHNVTWFQALRRWALPSIMSFAGGVGSMIATASYAWVFITPDRRGWHDYLANTVVIRSHVHH